ncbi:hypothetical protein [Chamaesiphon sp. GL140_3_metabinner_50]|nr:hypothetical protein [Chamaesiphon sp. GL140_3_metabinner_50]
MRCQLRRQVRLKSRYDDDRLALVRQSSRSIPVLAIDLLDPSPTLM